MIPTSIDGTDITSATIDGTDVTKITVDGQTVFSAEATLQDIVRPGDLALWWRMEQSTVSDGTKTGGVLDNNGISVADSSDYSPTSNSLGFDNQLDPNGGVFDLVNGQNSGSRETTSSSGKRRLEVNAFNQQNQELTLSCWADVTASDNDGHIWGWLGNNDGLRLFASSGGSNNVTALAGSSISSSVNIINDGYHHLAVSRDTSGFARLYIDGVQEASGSIGGGNSVSNIRIFEFSDDLDMIDGGIDDCRVYKAELSAGDISTMYTNTEP